MCFSPDVNHGHPRFDPAHDVGADLSVCLGRLPEITPHLLVSPVQRPLLLAGGPPRCAAPGGGCVVRHTTESTHSLPPHYTNIFNESVKHSCRNTAQVRAAMRLNLTKLIDSLVNRKLNHRLNVAPHYVRHVHVQRTGT